MSSESLFASLVPDAPLADRVRPRTLDEVRGQDHLVGQDASMRRLIVGDQIPSMIFWGPPGSGKTTMAQIIAETTQSRFVAFSAVTSGVKEVRELVKRAQSEKSLGRRTILFVDEIHRFNRAQQDAFLPYVEDGTVILIGATTENPSFEVNAALLSRCQVFVLKPIDVDAIQGVLEAAVSNPESGFGSARIDPEAFRLIAQVGEGDARRSLNILETAILAVEGEAVNEETVRGVLGGKVLLYDKSGEEHYNLISAFHKSMRGSDPHASLYWLARMMEAGEHPHYILRRMVRFASEDVGNADPRALSITLAAREAYDFLGSPEGDLSIAQAVVYLATAPKSNSVTMAYGKAQSDVREQPNLPVPLHIRNAPTGLMKDLGYGKGYKYAHDDPDGFTVQDYLPENLTGRKYYRPTDRGYEKQVKALMEWWGKLRAKRMGREGGGVGGE